MTSIPNVHRSAARLAAVQLLYSGLMHETTLPLDEALRAHSQQIIDNKSGDLYEEALDSEPDMVFLTRLLTDIATHLATVETLIFSFLSDKWKPERLNPTVRALLRAGVLELMEHPATPAQIIISEYTDIAETLCDANDVGFVNAVLDTIARSVRSEEMLVR